MLKKQKRQHYYKIVVWFHTGVKFYSLAANKKDDFMRNLKKRKDVIRYVIENRYIYVY